MSNDVTVARPLVTTKRIVIRIRVVLSAKNHTYRPNVKKLNQEITKITTALTAKNVGRSRPVILVSGTNVHRT